MFAEQAVLIIGKAIAEMEGGNSLAVVYIDRVFFLNTLLDYLLLLSTARLAGRPLRRWRFLACAAGGGLYAAVVFWIPKLAHPVIKLLSGLLIAGIAYGREPKWPRLMALFFLLSGGLAGVLLALGLAAGAPRTYLNRLYYAQISWPVLLLSAALFSLLLQMVFRQGARHGGKEIMDIIISLGGRRREICALYDTGNTLRDPVGGNPVLVLEQQELKELLPAEVWRVLNAKIQPEEKMAQLYRMGSDYIFTLLPFRSVGVSSGLLLAVWSDYIKIGNQQYKKILIALSPGPVGDGGGYQALWGAEEGGERHEMAEDTSHMAEKTYQAG